MEYKIKPFKIYFEFPHHWPKVRMVENVPIVVDGERISINTELKY